MLTVEYFDPVLSQCMSQPHLLPASSTGPTAPNVTVTALPDSIPVGGSGVLVCEATGGQPATYTFTWSDGAGETVTTGVTTSGGQSNLTISDAGDDSFGTYTCTVSSVYWNATGTGNITELGE